MNVSTPSHISPGRLILPCLLVLFLAGCATTPKIDWAGRVGTFTYDQAVLDFGPPDRYAKLTDGTVVAEWVTRRGYTRSYLTLGYGYGYGCWPYYPTYLDTCPPDYFLRLTFDAGGKLKAWKKSYK
jgi:hypothetical protein